MSDENKYDPEDIESDVKDTPKVEQDQDESAISDLLNSIGLSSLQKKRKGKTKDSDAPKKKRPKNMKGPESQKPGQNDNPLSANGAKKDFREKGKIIDPPVTIGQLLEQRKKADYPFKKRKKRKNSKEQATLSAGQNISSIGDTETMQAAQSRLVATLRLIQQDYVNTSTDEAQKVPSTAKVPDRPKPLKHLKKRSKRYKFVISAAAVLLVCSLIVYNNWSFLYPLITEPWPPNADVVAAYNEKYISKEDLKDFIALENVREQEHQYCEIHGFDHEKCDADEECEQHPIDSLPGYRELITMMATEQIIMEWADNKGITERDDVQHGLKDMLEDESVSQLVDQIHKKELTAESIPKSEVQQYYDENREEYGKREFSEVEHEIRDILALKKDEEFFPQYIEELKKSAGLEADFELLKVSEPTKDEITTYYQNNADQYQTDEAAEILEIKFTSSEDATEAVKKLGSGESFDDIAVAYGENGKAVKRTLEKGTVDPALETAVWKMVEGKISDLITSGDGSKSIVKLVRITPAGTKELAEVKEEITAILRLEKMDKEYNLRKDEALFTVHSRRYTLGEFYTEFQELSEEYQTVFSTFETKKQLLEQYIAKELMLEEVGDGSSDSEDTHDTEELKMQYLYQVMHQDEVEGNIEEPTDEEISAYYEENKSNLIESAKAKISIIWIAAGTDKKEAALSKAKEALSLINSGTGFAEVAKQYSEDLSAEAGGVIDEWIYEDHIPAELSQGIFGLEAGQMSEVIESNGGLYIILVNEKAERNQLSLEESTETIKGFIKDAKHEQLSTELEAKMFADSNFTIYNRTIRKMIKEQEKLQSN